MKKEFEYYQALGYVHPFTCDNGCGDLLYKSDNTIFCGKCGYEQTLNDKMIDIIKSVYIDYNMLNKIGTLVYNNACMKGFHHKPVAFGNAISNIHGELSEAFEDYRNGRELNEIYYEGNKPCGIPTELADVIIRVLDNCIMYNIDIGKAIQQKIEYNKTRQFMHGGKIV